MTTNHRSMPRRLALRALSLSCAAAVWAVAPMAWSLDKVVFKAADVHPPGYPTVVAVENMGKKITAATDGRITFQMFPNSVLGGEKEMIEQTQVGAIQILRTSLGPVGPVVPEVNVFNMPFVFRDIKHMRAVIDGPIGQDLLDKISASPAKMIGLAWMDGGSRSLYTKKPVRKPEDLKGQKIRMMGNPLFVDTMNAMGGNGISMGYGEVFTALQTGVIDGAENNPPSLYTANHFKAGAKYYTQTNHLIIPEILVMSKVTWDKLSPADQTVVKKAAREAQFEQRQLWDAAVADYSAKLKAEGVEFIEMDNKAFYDATAQVRSKYGAQFADLMKKISDVK
jgi:tripartite ATP-independent transporter DctP family solute receptor